MVPNIHFPVTGLRACVTIGVMKGKKLLFVALILALVLVGCSTSGTLKDNLENIGLEVADGALADQVPVPAGYNRVEFYWKGNADIATSDVWIWWDGKDGSGYLFEACDYGFKCAVDVPEEIGKVGFIVRTSCSEPGGSSWGTATKDFSDDRFAFVEGKITQIYLKTGDGLQYSSQDGGVTLNPIKVFVIASMDDFDTVSYSVSPAVTFESKDAFKIKDANGAYLEIASVNANGTLTLASELELDGHYTLEIEGYGEKEIVPNGIFDTERFIAEYTYSGDELGAVIADSKTTFKVWAPTASRVVLNLFNNGTDGEAYLSADMAKGEKGVWSYTADSSETACGHGTYYTYTVTTAVGTAEAVDPYAKAVGVNGNRGMVVDFSLTDPVGFELDTYMNAISTYSDAVIWETHVRDFSIANAQSAYKGKYLAFTERGLTNASGFPAGVDYLVQLGITHVHLLPIYDYATVDESNPDSSYNWGYDPKNYNALEGSYSTDPYHGEVRINEFKQAVQALHASGIGVVMDVVYNHTYSSDSSLNRIVPYYYYRYTSEGRNSNGSGCGNETASNRVMYRKYMVDSVVYWMTEYHLDGFRFDLMGIHDTETMQEIEKALHAINPKCLIYGEGWAGGTCAYSSSLLATQANISKVKATSGAAGSIAVFNDAIRDGLKGSVFTSSAKGLISGAVNKENAQKVAFGITGGASSSAVSWSVKNGMVINYMSAHDNNTLWDKLLLSNADSSEEERIQMNKFGAAVVMISRGTPFMLSGEEILRTKDGDSNSYKSSDEINKIDWDSVTPGSAEEDMFNWYKALIEMCAKYSWLKDSTVSCTVRADNSILATYRFRGNIVGLAVINPTASSFEESLPSGEWKVILSGETFVNEAQTVQSSVAVPAKGVVLLGK